MMARLARYAHKVFDLAERAGQLRDTRSRPQIPTDAVFLEALTMFLTRLASLHALEGQPPLAKQWRRKPATKKPSADTVARVVNQIHTAGLRDILVGFAHQLRRNKALDDNPWPLRFIAIDGHEFFSQ